MKVVVKVPRRSIALHRLYPIKSSGKYQLHRGGAISKERKKPHNTPRVDTLGEAIELFEQGWHLRMMNIETRGAPDIVSPERINVLEYPD